MTIEAMLSATIADKGDPSDSIMVAVDDTLDTPPDRYGRSPMLPRDAIEEAARIAQALDLHVYVGRSDDPRRPLVGIEFAEDALTAPLQSTRVSAKRH